MSVSGIFDSISRRDSEIIEKIVLPAVIICPVSASFFVIVPFIGEISAVLDICALMFLIFASASSTRAS